MYIVLLISCVLLKCMEMIGNGLSLKVILRMGAAWERCWFQPLLYDMFDAGWSFQVAMNKQSNYI